MNVDCDVLILGAGPAGSALATALGAQGFSVWLCDRKDFPRDKACGEFLSPECEPYLRELGAFAALTAEGLHRVHGMRLFGFGRRAVGRFVTLPGRPTMPPHGFAVRRRIFDDLLLQNARRHDAVRWLPRHEFIDVLRDPDGRIRGARLRLQDRSERTVAARFVVGADGVRSPLARSLGLQRPTRWLDRFALVGHFTGVEPRPEAEVHLFPHGYFAATTVDDGTFALNLIVDRSTLRERDGDLDAFVAGHLAHTPELQQRLHGASRRRPWLGTGPLAFTTTRQVVPGAALCGDACGYVDPITGEGIYFALFTAQRLAAALTQAFHDPSHETTALRDYVRQRHRELAPRLALARLLQRGMKHPFVTRGFLSALQRWPRLCSLLVTMTGDSVHPRDLLRPAFWRDFGRAVRA
ncbi:MAG: FAD-dependent monooxygenase [Planctomycetes bacterium]|nr:FAD-dependent monooxygenase [Planctomycetota bacterium]